MRTGLQFVSTPDGVRIACTVNGSGPPLVRVSGWMTHIERDRSGPVWGHWSRELSSRHRLVQFDIRGSGMSDRDVPDMGLEGWIRDLEAVMDGLGIERAPMLGICHGGCMAAAFAARHPERVSRLVLINSYPAGALAGGASEDAVRYSELLKNVIEVGWGKRTNAFRELFARLVMPDADEEYTAWLEETMRLTATSEAAARMWVEFNRYDIRSELPLISSPTLVCHVRGDSLVPFEAGRRLASAIPGSRFLPLEGNNHVVMPEDEAWPVFVRELRAFLAEDEPAGPEAGTDFAGLTRRERSVLDLVAAGMSNADIAETLEISVKTVRNNVTSILAKLELNSRSQAIVLARDAGFGRESVPQP